METGNEMEITIEKQESSEGPFGWEFVESYRGLINGRDIGLSAHPTEAEARQEAERFVATQK